MPSFPYASPSSTALTLIPSAPSISAQGIGIICGVAASVLVLCILSCFIRKRYMTKPNQTYYQKRTLNKKVKSIVTMMPQATAVPIEYTHAPRMPANTKLIKFSDSQYGL